MTLVIWIILAVAIVLGSSPFSLGRPPHTKAVNKLTNRARLPLPDHLRQPVLDRVRTQERATLAGGLGGLVLGAAAAALIAAWTGATNLGPVLVMFGTGVGLALGRFVGVRTSATTLAPDAPRVARSRSTEVADYTSGAERLAVRLVPVAVLVALAATWVLWAFAPGAPGVVVPALATVGAVLVVGAAMLLAGARSRVVEHPQQAHNDLELAWDDALRAEAIRDLQDTTVSTGLLASLGLLAMAGTWIIGTENRAGAEGLTLTLGVVLLAAAAAAWTMMLVPWISGRLQKNPSATMWAQHSFGQA